MKKKAPCTQYHLKHVIYLLDVNEIEELHVYFDDTLKEYRMEYVRQQQTSLSETGDFNRLKASTLLRDFAKMLVLDLVKGFELTYQVPSTNLAYHHVYRQDPHQVSSEDLIKELKQALNHASELVTALELEDFQVNRVFSKDGFNYKTAKMIDLMEHLVKAVQ